MTTSVKVATPLAAVSKTILDGTVNLGLRDGYTLCGNRQYSLQGTTYSHTSLTATILNAKTAVISLHTTSDAHITHPSNGVTQTL
jgi:hypothetical protein